MHQSVNLNWTVSPHEQDLPKDHVNTVIATLGSNPKHLISHNECVSPNKNKTIPEMSTRNQQRFIKYKFPAKFMFLVLMTFALTLVFTTEPALGQESAQRVSGFNPQIWLKDALLWINGLGTEGALAFILLYIVATVAFLPGSILTLGAGVVFGVVMGSVYVFIGATIGATAAFLVGRYLARGWVAKKIAGNKKFRAIDEAVGREGLKIVLLTRLSPVFPFNLLKYAYGLTGVSLRDYVVASIGMIPGTIMYVYIGSLAGNIATIGTASQPGNPGVQWTIRIIGFIATVAVTIYVTQVARKALENEVLESKDR